MGGNLAAQLHHAQVLDDKSVDIMLRGIADGLRHFFHFPVGNQGIQGQMHLHATDVAVLNGIHQRLGGKILRALPCIKGTHAQVDRIGTVLHRSPKGFHRPRRGQQFQHNSLSVPTVLKLGILPQCIVVTSIP